MQKSTDPKAHLAFLICSSDSTVNVIINRKRRRTMYKGVHLLESPSGTTEKIREEKGILQLSGQSKRYRKTNTKTHMLM